MFFYNFLKLEVLEGWIPQGHSPKYHHLRERIYSTLNSSILVVILQKLPEQDRTEFAKRFAANPSDESLVNFLVDRIGPSIKDDVERAYVDYIKKVAPSLTRMEDEPDLPYWL